MLGTSANFGRRLRGWYAKHRRDLPWRLPGKNTGGQKLDPYHVMVSEAMLQQTQVATVIPYFHRFIEQFPTLEALADADTQQVLRAWQGLGYYSRARNLQRAAKKIITDFAGQIPAAVQDLLELPGVGRYTAGAISSIAFEKRSPIVDGNVARVLCRLDGIRKDPREPDVRAKIWQRAEEILPAKQIGDFNSSLMELGALLCTPRSPQCLICPVNKNCAAYSLGLQDQIPPVKKAKKTPLCQRWTFCVRRQNQYLVQQRPATGRWAGMWQFLTIEAADTSPSPQFMLEHFGLLTTEPVQIAMIEHALTHRRYRFDVFTCDAQGKTAGQWHTLEDLNELPMPGPQLKIRELLMRSSLVIVS